MKVYEALLTPVTIGLHFSKGICQSVLIAPKFQIEHGTLKSTGSFEIHEATLIGRQRQPRFYGIIDFSNDHSWVFQGEGLSSDQLKEIAGYLLEDEADYIDH